MVKYNKEKKNVNKLTKYGFGPKLLLVIIIDVDVGAGTEMESFCKLLKTEISFLVVLGNIKSVKW